MTAINAILQRWRDGDLSTSAKRRAIADENRRYYGGTLPPLLERAGRRYESRRHGPGGAP